MWEGGRGENQNKRAGLLLAGDNHHYMITRSLGAQAEIAYGGGGFG